MRRSAEVTVRNVVALTAAAALTLTISACGQKPDPAQPGTSTAATDTRCPNEPTQKFAMARFATSIGLAAGTFHHWIYQPYRAGTFASGANGRELALVKASSAGLFAAQQLGEARSNVAADPILCRAFIGPLTKAETQLNGLADQLRRGDVSGITAAESLLTDVTRTAADQGIAITESNGL